MCVTYPARSGLTEAPVTVRGSCRRAPRLGRFAYWDVVRWAADSTRSMMSDIRPNDPRCEIHRRSTTTTITMTTSVPANRIASPWSP